MDITDLVAPVAFPDGDDVGLGHDDRALDGALHLLVAFPAQPHVVLPITDDHVGLEPSPLPGLGLLLDGLDLHDLFLDLPRKQEINDLGFFDRDSEVEDFLQRGDDALLDQSAQLCHGAPIHGLDLLLHAVLAGLFLVALYATLHAWLFTLDWLGFHSSTTNYLSTNL